MAALYSAPARADVMMSGGGTGFGSTASSAADGNSGRITAVRSAQPETAKSNAGSIRGRVRCGRDDIARFLFLAVYGYRVGETLVCGLLISAGLEGEILNIGLREGLFHGLAPNLFTMALGQREYQGGADDCS